MLLICPFYTWFCLLPLDTLCCFSLMLGMVGENSTTTIVPSTTQELTIVESEMPPPTAPIHPPRTDTRVHTSANIAQGVDGEDVSKKRKLEGAESAASTRKKPKVWEQFQKLAACKYCQNVYVYDPYKHDNNP